MDLAFDLVELAPFAPSELEIGTAPRLREVAFRSDAWLPDEDTTLRRMFADDCSIAEIAEEIGRGEASVADRAYRLGLRRNSKREWNELEDGFLNREYGHAPTAELAAQLHRSCSAVYARAGFLGLTEGNPPPWSGWEDEQLKAGYTQGVPCAQIAVLIGRPLSGLVSRASALGLRHANQPEDWSDEEMALALELAHQGHRYLKIIEMLVSEGFPRRSKSGFGQRLRILGYGRGWGRPWTVEEENLLRGVYARGESAAVFARRVGRSRTSVSWKAGELGLNGTHAHPNGWRTERCWTEEEEAILRAEYGKTENRELARKLDRKWSAIRVRANHLGLKHGWMRAFTEDEDRAILIAWREGISITDLCAALNRDPSVVSKHCRKIHGVAFSDPDRPKKGPKTRRKDRPRLTLCTILEMEVASA